MQKLKEKTQNQKIKELKNQMEKTELFNKMINRALDAYNDYQWLHSFFGDKRYQEKAKRYRTFLLTIEQTK